MFRFAGVVTDREPEDAKAQLASMLASMVREPADVPQICSVPELRCYLGWISRGEPGAEGDALVVQQDDKVLIFSGEHFGHGGPASALLGADDSSREHRLRELNGWFAGVLVDVSAKSVVLFNDRFGLRRVYYSRGGAGFAFASEAKALLAIQHAGPRWHLEALGDLVACGSVMSDRTLFQDVFVLPAGSAWRIAGATEITKCHYFSADEWEAQPCLTEDEYYARLKATLSRVIPRYLRGAPNAAISLTGGVDSRVITAFAGNAGRDLSAYTFGGMDRDCYDVRIARQVAGACGYPYEVLRLGREFLRDFSRHAEATVWVTDGTLDIGAAHEVYLSGLARQIAPVRVTGNYGSEIFRGVTTFKPLGLSEDLLEPAFLPYITESVQSLTALKRAHPVSFAAFKELPWHLFGRLNAGQSLLIPRSPYTDNELVALAYQAPATARHAAGLWNRLISEQDRRLASIPTDRGHVANAPPSRTFPNRLYNHLLFKAEWYYESGMPHWLAGIDHRFSRNGASPFFAGMHKIESYRRWFRDELFEYLDSILSASSCADAPGVNWDRCRTILTAHREGRGNFVQEIGRFATISLVHQLFFNARRRTAPPPRPTEVRRAMRAMTH